MNGENSVECDGWTENVKESWGGGRKAISKYCHSTIRDKMWIADAEKTWSVSM